jgi:mannose-1-phosphate guanylyltransferase/mannose-1-phosphate guanylyltransferase/mannose-6-phosphate isomerase
MLQMTLARVADAERFAPPILVAAADQAEAIRAQLAERGIVPDRLILEPLARNTAAAIALAALATDPDSLLLVMPSDHLIRDPAPLLEAVAAAVPLASEGWLVTFGITPHRPDPGFGYILRGHPLGPGLFKAERFVEKPDASTAADFVAHGGYQWNAGIFLFSAGGYLEALAEHAADIADGTRRSMERAAPHGMILRPETAALEVTRAKSIDHAVMEHSDRVAVVPVAMDWSDLGSWQALYEASEKDSAGNSVLGDALLLDGAGNLIRSDGPLVVAIGVSDLAIVATPDAILIVPRSESQRVQQAVAELAKRGDPRL